MRTLTLNVIFLIAAQFASSLFGAVIAAEYGDNFIIPQVEIVVQTDESYAIALSPASWGNLIPAHETGSKYFLASRRGHDFEPITHQEFSNLLPSARQISRLQASSYIETNESRNSFKVVTGPNVCSAYSLPPERLEFIGFSVPIKLDCNTRIADAIRIGDEVWVLTYEEGGHGSYGAEGVIVLDSDGVEKSRVDTGSFAPIAVIGDQNSGVVWVVTEDRVLLISSDYKILNTFWPLHEFNASTERPEVAIVSSQEKVLTDPFAIFAYTLGDENYAQFYNSIKDLERNRDQQMLYNYFMSGPSYQPSLPEELNALIPSAKPTEYWRKFLCMLQDPRAEALCKLELSEWAYADSIQ